MPTDIFPTPALLDRFMSKVRKDGDHWLWTGGTTGTHSSAHGRFKLNGKMEQAHRVSYMLFKGHLPSHRMVLHKCNIGLCVKPDHLYSGDQQQNMQDRQRAGRTARGERHGQFRHPDSLAREILATPGTPSEVAAKFHEHGITKSYVANLRAGRIRGYLQAA